MLNQRGSGVGQEGPPHGRDIRAAFKSLLAARQLEEYNWGGVFPAQRKQVPGGAEVEGDFCRGSQEVWP